jgi:tRNA(Ile)-lysidine synthase
MAASRKPPSADLAVLQGLRGKSLAVGLSGGVDSIVLLDVLKNLAPRFGYRLSAFHVNHGLSGNANAWQEFCAERCLQSAIPFRAVRVKVARKGKGLEAAARDARLAEMKKLRVDALALAHQLDDQAETVLLNLLRGAGIEGARAMPAHGNLGKKLLIRPLLSVPRSEIRAYARRKRLEWIEDESNSDEALTRNFIRRRVGPVLERKFPRWRESLARAARHFSSMQLDANKLLRSYLSRKGLRAPSEAKLLEMLKQLGGRSAAVAHEGKVLRTYRGKVFLSRDEQEDFAPVRWKGEPRLVIPALGGELRFASARGRGIGKKHLKGKNFQVRLRSGGERLQPDARRPRRTLKNLFQESGVPPWERARLPLLFCGDQLVWAPGLGIDVRYAAATSASGFVPEWRAA